MSSAVSLACRESAAHDGLHHFRPAVADPGQSAIEIKNHVCGLGRGVNEGSSSMLSWGGAVGTATVKAGCGKKTSLHRETA